MQIRSLTINDKVWHDFSLANLANQGIHQTLISQTLICQLVTFILFTIGCIVNSPNFLLPTFFESQFAKLSKLFSSTAYAIYKLQQLPYKFYWQTFNIHHLCMVTQLIWALFSNAKCWCTLNSCYTDQGCRKQF